MARPVLTREVSTRLVNGERVRVVEFSFGRNNTDPDFYQSTLLEDWAARPLPEQTAEMNRRYDEWIALRDAVHAPAVVTPADLDLQILDIDAQIRMLQRQRLDIEEQRDALLRAEVTPEG